jgi:predicted transposase YbfD/YdcC
MYPLDEVLLLSLLGVLAGAETFVDIARFGDKKLALLRRFRPFADGTPAHDRPCTRSPGRYLRNPRRRAVPILLRLLGRGADRSPGCGDRHRQPAPAKAGGKTLRRSFQNKGGRAAIHMVSAFAARQRLVLGQVKVAEKSNEIIAIPKLLDMLTIAGAIVTIDAMGCQRDIAQKIIDKKADYVVALKGNQGSLHADVELFVAEQKAKDFSDTTVSRDTTIDGDHGRIETRTTTVIHDVDWLQQRHGWPGLKRIVIVEATRETADKIEQETRIYVTSLALLANLLGPILHSHWAVENSLHWVMDMVFRDDECRVRTDHAPANFTTIKHIAHNLLRKASGKDSLRLRRKVAAWDDEFLASLIAA